LLSNQPHLLRFCFYQVPRELRISFVACVSFLWLMYLSYASRSMLETLDTLEPELEQNLTHTAATGSDRTERPHAQSERHNYMYTMGADE
jgi:hypothetical protein